MRELGTVAKQRSTSAQGENRLTVASTKQKKTGLPVFFVSVKKQQDLKLKKVRSVKKNSVVHCFLAEYA